jgi:hypothetical protein
MYSVHLYKSKEASGSMDNIYKFYSGDLKTGHLNNGHLNNRPFENCTFSSLIFKFSNYLKSAGSICKDISAILKFNIAPVFLSKFFKIDLKQELCIPGLA